MSNINQMVCEALVFDIFEMNAFEKHAHRGDLSSAASKKGFTSGAGRSLGTMIKGTYMGGAHLASQGKNPSEASKTMFHQAKKTLGVDNMSSKAKLNPASDFRAGMASLHSNSGR